MWIMPYVCYSSLEATRLNFRVTKGLFLFIMKYNYNTTQFLVYFLEADRVSLATWMSLESKHGYPVPTLGLPRDSLAMVMIADIITLMLEYDPRRRITILRVCFLLEDLKG